MSIFVKCKSVPILEIIHRYSIGKPIKRGRYYFIQSPFFKVEKTPSCCIRVDTNTFRDYSESVSGDSVKLVSIVFGLNALESARKICQDFGLSAEENINSKQIQETIRSREQEREQQIRLNWELKCFFETCVKKYKLFQQTLEDYGSLYGFDYRYCLIQMHRDKWECICNMFINASHEGRILIHRMVQNECKC